jgi:hypothetical protein
VCAHGNIEAGQPHIHHDRQSEIVARILEAVRKLLSLRLTAHVPRDQRLIVRSAGHDDLH